MALTFRLGVGAQPSWAGLKSGPGAGFDGQRGWPATRKNGGCQELAALGFRVGSGRSNNVAVKSKYRREGVRHV